MGTRQHRPDHQLLLGSAQRKQQVDNEPLVLYVAMETGSPKYMGRVGTWGEKQSHSKILYILRLINLIPDKLCHSTVRQTNYGGDLLSRTLFNSE